MLERPVILVVDDEPTALASMLDALTHRFGGDYRVEPHLSAQSALDAVSRLKAEGEEIALVIADQWMPEMNGDAFLGQVRTIEPTAKRALLVSWGDHDASPVILQACALGQLDNYLYKPWAPAEVHLYPYVSAVSRGMDPASPPRNGVDPHRRRRVMRRIGRRSTSWCATTGSGPASWSICACSS